MEPLKVASPLSQLAARRSRSLTASCWAEFAPSANVVGSWRFRGGSAWQSTSAVHSQRHNGRRLHG